MIGEIRIRNKKYFKLCPNYTVTMAVQAYTIYRGLYSGIARVTNLLKLNSSRPEAHIFFLLITLALSHAVSLDVVKMSYWNTHGIARNFNFCS